MNSPTLILCDQRSDEWRALRTGKVTASRINDVLAEIKKGEAATRRNYKAEIIAETLTGIPAESYISKEMQWGIDNEQFARAAYEIVQDVAVDCVGFAVHPQIARFGASPDGLVGDIGLVEIKCPNTSTHLDYILAGEVPAEYQPQMLAAMSCTGREWCDFVSFDPRLPERFRLFVRRFYRHEGRIAEMEIKVARFLAEVDEVIQRLESASNDLTGILRKSVESVQGGPQPIVAVMDAGREVAGD
jgi:putative phage-type endonuclease